MVRVVKADEECRVRLRARNRLVQRRVVPMLSSFSYVGKYWSSAGPCSHGVGFDAEVPTWLRPEIIAHGRKVWSLWPRGGFWDDLGDLLFGTKVFKMGGYSYLVVYGVRDHDDFTDIEATVYRRRDRR